MCVVNVLYNINLQCYTRTSAVIFAKMMGREENEQPTNSDLILPELEFQNAFALSTDFMEYERNVDSASSSILEPRHQHLIDALIDRDESKTQNNKADSIDGMSLADWRWAAKKRYWDPEHRCWNEELGGMKGYLEQRNKRRAERKNRQSQVGIEHDSTCATSQRQRVIHNREGDKYTVRQLECYNPVHDLESPLGLSSHDSFAMHTTQPLLNFMVRHGWGHLAVRGFWTAGYQAEPVMRIVYDLPPSLHAAIGKAVDCAQYAAVCAARLATADFNASVLPGKRLQQHAKSAVLEWEGDSADAFFELRFDPDTQMRVGAAANTRAADLLGMRQKELLARLERFDVPLPLVPLDAVAIFLHALSATRKHVDTCYHRLSPSAGQKDPAESMITRRSPPPPAVLVCSTTAKDFDAFGRVHTVP
jgi:hypothetical protein